MPNLPKDRPLTEGLKPVALQRVSKPGTPDDHAIRDTELKNLRCVGAFTWAKGPAPTIIVPGTPPRWLEKPVPFQVVNDSGIVYVDQTGYNMGDKPLLPLIKAVEAMSQDIFPAGGPDKPVNWREVDFVTDRNALRKLLRWIDGSVSRAFRIDTQLAGSGTVLLNRWEARDREYARRTSYAWNFRKYTTSKESRYQDGTPHHRIVQYKFRGLSMVMSFGVDAFLSSASPETTIEELTADFGAIQVNRNAIQEKSNGLTVRRGGHLVPASSLIELKSSFKGTINWMEEYPQIYFSQTPWLYKAIHQAGRYHSVTKTALKSPELADAAEKSKERFAKLADALQRIKKIVVKAGLEGRLSLVFEGNELKVYGRERQDSCLPADAMAIFSKATFFPQSTVLPAEELKSCALTDA